MAALDHVEFPKQGTVHAARRGIAETLCGRQRRWMEVTRAALTCRTCQKLLAADTIERRRVDAILGRRLEGGE
jgi:hypothetical protein